MGGRGSNADCPCGYHADCLMHGTLGLIVNDKTHIVIAYANDRPELVSAKKHEAKLKGMDFFEVPPIGMGYRCPACGNLTLVFSNCPLNWD